MLCYAKTVSYTHLIWRILREVIEVAPNYENAVHVTHYGWMAVAFAFAAVLTYIAGLMCSHLAAFRIATNLRLAMTKQIATLPLGEIEQFGSGKLRRTISETTGATETYLAHQMCIRDSYYDRAYIRVGDRFIPVVNHGSSNCFDFDRSEEHTSELQSQR